MLRQNRTREGLLTQLITKFRAPLAFKRDRWRVSTVKRQIL